jgi:type IV pilus assembly protein PilV
MYSVMIKHTRTFKEPLIKEKGFTMVEVLVAIVVLSIGLLGLAGLQATSLKNNNSSYQRSIASMLAYDMLDRIRANRDGMIAGNYNSVSPGSFPGDPGCSSSNCSVSALAQYDIFEWGEQLDNLLPSGTGQIEGNGANTIYTITVMWDDERTGADGTDCSGDPAVDLTCFTVSTQL